MESNLAEQEPVKAVVCANCSHPIIEPGFKTALCSDCRALFIKFPIPVWVKFFGGLIVLLVAFSMINLPKNISTAMHFDRGVDAISAKKYLTATRELSGIVKKEPEFTEAKEHLAIAAFYNGDLPLFSELMKQLNGKLEDDLTLYSQLTDVLSKAENYYPTDSFYKLIESRHSMDSIPLNELEDYVIHHPGEPFATARLASMLIDENRYQQCDSLVTGLLVNDQSYLHALHIKTSVKRQLKQFDSSHYYCDQILIRNPESSYGLSSNARTFLAERNDQEGLRFAESANKLDPDDGYVIATLALAYYFTNKKQESDQLIATLKSNPVNTNYLKFVEDVKSGKEKFRN